MLKVAKARPKKGASTDAELFDIVVCQVDHQIVCEPWKARSGGSKKQTSQCKTTKWVKPVARCVDFDAGVWNAGPTCIANLAHKDTHTQCSIKASIKARSMIKTLCKVATQSDNRACQTFRESLAEYY